MTLAYVFWHRPKAEVSAELYEDGLRRFHQQLVAGPIPGFLGSWTLRVPELPWLPGGGYEDWYLIDGFATLGTLATHAVDDDRVVAHDVMAGSVLDGAGGVYARLLGGPGGTGESGTRESWAGWFTKADGVRYPELRANLETMLDAGTLTSVWQRQLVLGPAPEFRLVAPAPVTVTGTDLRLGVKIGAVMSVAN